MSAPAPGSSRAIWTLIAVLWIGLFVAAVWLDEQAVFPLWRLSAPTLLRLGGLLVPLSSVTQGWRLATAWLLHIDLLHLLSNVCWLGLLAWLWPIRAATLPSIGIGIVSSGTATVLLAPKHALLSAGGSGVLLTLFATIATGSVTARARFFAVVACGLLVSSGLWFHVDWAAHAGGLCAGLAWGLFQRRQATTA